MTSEKETFKLILTATDGAEYITISIPLTATIVNGCVDLETSETAIEYDEKSHANVSITSAYVLEWETE